MTRLAPAAAALLLVASCAEPDTTVESATQALTSCSAAELDQTRSGGACGPGLDGTSIERCSATGAGQYAWLAIACDVTQFPTSTRRCDTSVLDTAPAPAEAVYVDIARGSHTGWADVLDDLTATRTDIVLAAGDYMPWGALVIDGTRTPSGTASRPRTIRYGGPGPVHPVHRIDRSARPTTEARIQGLLFHGGAHHWIARGLTIRAPVLRTNDGLVHVMGNASNLVIDSFLVEDSAGSYGIRLRDSHDVCIQSNVVRNATTVKEQIAIGVKPLTGPVTGVRIIDNEVYDWTDQIQITAFQDFPVDYWIENNDLYITPNRHVTDPATGKVLACAENAIDIKVGNPTAISRIVRNRMWGFRETPRPEQKEALCGPDFTSGAPGDAIVVHDGFLRPSPWPDLAMNIDIEDNIIGDSVHALGDGHRDGGRNLAVSWNYFHEIPAADAAVTYEDRGRAVLVVEDDVSVISNRFAFADQLCPTGRWPLAGWNPGAPLFMGNGHIGPTAMAPGVCDFAGNWELAGAHDLRYARRRWTGPEIETVEAGYR